MLQFLKSTKKSDETTKSQARLQRLRRDYTESQTRRMFTSIIPNNERLIVTMSTLEMNFEIIV